MNSNANNNINTGVAPVTDEFRWFKPSSDVHVEGVKFSAPAYDIPPTPASSYSNLHIVLDTVHASTETITRGTLAPHTHFDSSLYTSGQHPQLADSISSRSVPSFVDSTLPSTSVPITSSLPTPSKYTSLGSFNNKLDSVPIESFKAIPMPVDPEQPGARASDALTSLKSEVAPMPPAFVALDEIDPLSERTDRQLPEVVNLSLFDESEAQRRDSKWSNQWNNVGKQLLNKDYKLHNIRPLHDGQFDKVGDDIRNKNYRLRHAQLMKKKTSDLDALEDAERQWRMHQGVDAIWSGRVHNVGLEITNSVLPLGWSMWLNNLKNKAVSKSADLVDSAKDSARSLADKSIDILNSAEASAEKSARDLAGKSMDMMDAAKDSARNIVDKSIDLLNSAEVSAEDSARALAGKSMDMVDAAKDIAGDIAVKSADMLDAAKDLATTMMTPAPIVAPKDLSYGIAGEPIDFTFKSRRCPQSIIDAEEYERMDRMSKGINPVLSGQWYRLGREVAALNIDALTLASEWMKNLKNQATRRGNSIIESAKDSYAHLNVPKAPVDASLPRGLIYEYAPIDFTFKSRRVPAEIIALEERERANRIANKPSPVILGQLHRVGLELKHKYSLRPTLMSTANRLTRVASDLVEKAEEMLGNAASSIAESGKNLMNSAVVAPEVDFAEHGKLPLNLFAFDAEPIDFTFKSRRCPQYLIALEEKERADRMADGFNALSYGKWNSVLSAPHKTIMDEPASMIKNVRDVLVDSASDMVNKSKGWTGYFGALAHSAFDTTAHLVDVAKHSLPGYDGASIDAISKAEEAERVRRMGEKVDPIMAARLGRVQDELLHKSVKSV